MDPIYLTYKNSRICYYRFGTGKKLVLCFHGYGETAASFFFLEQYAGKHFTFCSLDLPFHGKTEWNEGLNFSWEDLKIITEKIIAENFRSEGYENRVILAGFSLGGRIALSIYQLMPEKVERILLMAPDGLKVNFWYWLSTQTWLGNKFFRFTMRHPQWFFGFLKLLNRLGLVNPSIFKFVHYYINNPEVREELYNRWTTLRKIKPGLKKIKNLILRHQTILRLIYGKYDKIILASRGEKFINGIDDQCSLVVVSSGHQVLHEKYAGAIVEGFTR